MDKMKVIFVNVTVALPRNIFDRRIEISKYCNVISVIGWVSNNSEDLHNYINDNHSIVKLSKSKLQGTKIKARVNELMFVLKAIYFLKNNKADVVIIERQRFAFLYPIFLPSLNLTGSSYLNSVNQNKLNRMIDDYLRKLIMFPFNNILLPHQHLVEYYSMNKKNTYVVNWGQKPISDKPKDFVNLKLLYIGRFSGRKIDETITGLYIYMKKYRQKYTLQYHIIGSGKRKIIDKICGLIEEYGLEKIVFYHGYLSDDEIKYYFDVCNVGVSYVPITEYYTNLHVTKTDEYLLSGLAVLATATNYNMSVINDSNGILINDSPVEFALGLDKISKNLSQYKSEIITESMEKKTVAYNVQHRILPALEEIKKHNLK